MFSYRRTMVRRRVLLTLTTGTVLSGILWQKTGPLLVLRDPALLEAGREPTPMDGEVIVERSRVEMVQVLPTQ